jgi:hypothetical protein
VDALGELGQEDAFLLVLEDLHWSGPRSLDLLSLLAAEAIPARIVVIGTYAPFAGAVAHTDDPLTRAAHVRGHARLQLLPLSEGQVKDYLEHRFGGVCADALAGPIYGATMGHAASVGKVADDLVAGGILRHGVSGWSLGVRLRRVHPAINDAMTDAIRAQLEGLRAEERKLLATAAGVGWEFTDKAVVDAIGASEGLTDTLDLLALHLPMFERLAPRSGRTMPVATYRFRHRQWFEMLRGQASMVLA